MDFKILTKKLGFCEEAERFIFDFDKNYRHADFAPHWEKLYAAGEEAEGLNGLRAALSPDPDGMKILVCMLHCALHTHEAYRARGIPDRIFFETMRFLPRFVNARARIYGRPIFPNDWWFYRELSLREFRLGALEYEMLADNGERKISVHIPEKADLSLPSLRASLREARKFFAEFFPEYADAEMYCDSWLMSPALKELLPASSNILGFQNGFELVRWDKESDACLDWIFPRRDMPPEQLAENTSLQRKAKAYLIGGGKIGWALGKMKKHPFAE